jgi:hypothetical protein
VNVKVACAFPAVAVPIVGAAGTVQVDAHTAALVQMAAQHCPSLEQLLVNGKQGVTEFDAADAGPVPAALVAVTVKV